MKIEVTPPEQSPIKPYAFDHVLNINMLNTNPGFEMVQVEGQNDFCEYKPEFYRAYYGNYLVPKGSFVNYESKYDSGEIVLTKVSDLVIFVNRIKLILGLEET